MKDNNKVLIDKKIKELKKEIEDKKEQKIVNLFIEIIVSITLKEYYEKSNKIFEVQSVGTE